MDRIPPCKSLSLMGNIISLNPVFDNRTNVFFLKNAPENNRKLLVCKRANYPLGDFHAFYKNGIAVFILLAPASGKSLSCGQRIRITGISPLRGSLRAVSGSTIIILAVIAYMRSCLMVCDRDSRSSLRYPVGWRIMAYLTSGYHQD